MIYAPAPSTGHFVFPLLLPSRQQLCEGRGHAQHAHAQVPLIPWHANCWVEGTRAGAGRAGRAGTGDGQITRRRLLGDAEPGFTGAAYNLLVGGN